ncbi:MAG: acyltransferase [Candidatus Thorarchaeota archaeon]|jgi:acetyltransferase-like isoleucine patch superfamily enzyme
MKPRILAYGIYMGLSFLISLTIAFIIALVFFLMFYQSFDSFLIGIGWPFADIQAFFEIQFTGSLPAFFFERFWFLIFFVPLGLFCYSLFLGVLAGMFKLTRRGIPYLKNGTYPPETEEWLLYEYYEVYYYMFRHFIWFFSLFLESKLLFELFGAKIGKGSILGGAIVLTPDRTIVGDNCLIGFGSILSAHSYEDRTLYLKDIKIGNNVTVGGYAIIFAGAEIGDNVIIGANTVVPRDKVVPPNTIWLKGKAYPRKDLEWDEEERDSTGM